MLLYKNLYLTSFLYLFSYIEGNIIILLSIFSIKKFRLFSNLLITSNLSLYCFYNSIVSNIYIFHVYFKKLLFFLNDLFISSYLGYSHGFRLIGRGYKIYIHLNNFIFKLGYSHNIYYVLPFVFKGFSKSKLKRFWIIKGLNYLSLSNLIYFIQSFKLPNTYMQKGIYAKNDLENYNLKATKLGLL